MVSSIRWRNLAIGLQSMKIRTDSGRPIIIGNLSLAALVCFGAIVVPAHADAPITSAFSPSEASPSISLDALPEEMPLRVVSKLGTGLSSAGDTGDISAAQDNISLPQGNEMSVIAGVELERTDRRFRSRVVNWARNQSLAAGLATDFLLHGSDTGIHLDVQSRSSYVIRWRKRF